jgi:hypothetical protein
MGLDTSHDCWTGAYSAFMRWRTELAKAAGYPVSAEHRIGEPDYELPWDEFEAKNYQGEWDEQQADPLVYLLVHSDCDGVIHPEQGLPLAVRLEELALFVDESKSGGHIRSMKEKTLQFARGLREAAAAGEDVEFY